MRFLQSVYRRLRSILLKDSSNIELSEELQFHLDRQMEEYIAGGMSPDQARLAARGDFGSVPLITQGCYESRGVAWFEDLVQDLRYGLRTLRTKPSFSVITILTLALGIGACTAIFSLVNAVLLRSLPYGDAERLVYLFTPNPRYNLPAEIFGPSNADFLDLKKQTNSFAGMTLFNQATYNLAVGDRTQRVGVAKVDADFFTTLQSFPELGRVFELSDQQPGNVVVISHAIWQAMFSGNADVVGSKLLLDGRSYQVVGVMPKEFGYPHKSDLRYANDQIDTTQLWVPYALTPQQTADREESSGFAVARLKPGVTMGQGQAEMGTIMSRLNLLHDPKSRGWYAVVRSFRDSAFGPVRPLMFLLLGAVGFVLLIACGNAANLLLAHAASRTHELGVRATLGARRSRLLRQMLTESLVLSAAAGLLGIGLAWLFLRALLSLNPGDIPRMQNASLDVPVMAFLVFTTMLTSILFGILPSLSATRIHLAEFLKSAGQRGIMGDRRRLRNSLVITQVAMVVILLTGAGLLLRSYLKVISVPTGFSRSTVAVSVELGPQYNTVEKQRAFFVQLLDKIKPVRGVQDAGLVNHLPLSGAESLTLLFEVKGFPVDKNQLVEERSVTPNYLSAMQMPLFEGRPFTDQDGPGHPPVAIVNRAFARKYFPGRDAVGGQIRSDPSAPWTTVVGVIGDVRNMSLEAPAEPQIYRPLWQDSEMHSCNLAVRSSLPISAVVSTISAAVRSLDPDLAIASVHTMGDAVSKATARRRFQTTLLTVFSAIAMIMALVGVYGLLAYSVRQRTGEIGLRMALGSSRVRVVLLVLREALGLVGMGLLAGIAFAFPVTRLLRSFLYDVPALDPITFVLVPALLFVAALAACLIPSSRAASVDPISALRQE